MEFYLPIFPEGGLANSITTTVWIGILVVAFFNLRFGWVLSGLVVPGYLVPLLLVKPIAVVVILVESFATYSLMYFFSTYLARIGFWADFFGRDRFFLILILSTIVRILFDGYLLPEFGESINAYFNINFDYRNNLHSFGLIVVALIANQLYKPGLIRGTVPFFITIFITYLITRFVLIEYTNFTLSNLSYLYEDISTSILASPKAYIILLTTAFIASRMNLRYGWDFNGILIPALLALQWYQPTKILISFVEALIILYIASMILKLPLFKNSSIEGARKLILFFNVGFFYKFLLSILIIKLFPQEKVSDYFAFGYLLSTLIAIKMYDKEIIIRLTRATIETSFYSIIVASIIGFSLTFVPNFFVKDIDIKVSRENIVDSNLSLYEVMQRDKITLYSGHIKNSFKQPTPEEIEKFQEAIRILKNYKNSRDELLKASSLLFDLNYKIEIIKNRYLYLSEIEPKDMWGFYVIDTKAKNDLLIETPFPLDEWATFEISFFLFKEFSAKTLAISGATKDNSFDKSSNVLTNRYTLFNVFHKLFNKSDTFQIRGFSAKSLRVLEGVREKVNSKSTIHIKNSIPKDLNLVKLKSYINFKTLWNQDELKNILREESVRGFAELYLNREDRRVLLSKPLIKNLEFKVKEQKIDGYLGEWVLENRDNLIAKVGSNLYKAPTLQELLFFDQEILKPIYHLIDFDYKNLGWSTKQLKELKSINQLTSILNYKIIRYKDTLTNEEYLILTGDKNSKFWGTYIFRVGITKPYVIQIPRPLYEKNSFEYGLSLFDRLQAKALLISGTHPFSNFDGSSDIIKSKNRQNLFNLVNQVILRESLNLEIASIQIRAFGYRKDKQKPKEDIILASANGEIKVSELSKISKNIVQKLTDDSLIVGFANGEIDKVGYEIGGISQALYLKQSINKEFLILWLSPEIRDKYKTQNKNNLLNREFETLKIESIKEALFKYISEVKKESFEIPKELNNLIESYIKSLDIIILQQILNTKFNFKRLIDANSKRAFLLIFKKDNLITVIDLNSQKFNKMYLDKDNLTLDDINSFLDSKSNQILFN